MNRWTSLLQTSLLLGGMMALVAMVGTLVAGGMGLVMALGLGVGLAAFGQAPPRLVMFLQGGRPLLPFQAPGLHRAVEELARRADLPRTPHLYALPSRELNAFAVGSAGNGAAVAVSDGLLRLLSPREIVGVVAHEVSHIRNGDTTVLSLATVVTRLTSTFATVGQFLVILNIPMMLAGYAPVSWWLVLMLLGAPTASALLLLGLSRAREFEADREAARLPREGRPGHGRSRPTMAECMVPAVSVAVSAETATRLPWCSCRAWPPRRCRTACLAPPGGVA